jgi:hypothetical protein
VQTAALAVLLHRKRLVSLLHLEYAEIGRALLAALIALLAACGLAHALPAVTTHRGDALTLAAGTVAWAVAVFVILTITGSKLLSQIMRRKG